MVPGMPPALGIRPSEDTSSLRYLAILMVSLAHHFLGDVSGWLVELKFDVRPESQRPRPGSLNQASFSLADLP